MHIIGCHASILPLEQIKNIIVFCTFTNCFTEPIDHLNYPRTITETCYAIIFMINELSYRFCFKLNKSGLDLKYFPYNLLRHFPIFVNSKNFFKKIFREIVANFLQYNWR